MKEIHGFSLKFLRVKTLKTSKFYALVSTATKGVQRTSTMFGDLRDRTPLMVLDRDRVLGLVIEPVYQTISKPTLDKYVGRSRGA